MNLKTLKTRQTAEEEFHNRKFSGERKKTFYDLGFTNVIFNQLINKIGNIEGKKVLEFGCGEGWFTKMLADKGAEVWSFDISEEAVKKNKVLIESLHLQNQVHVEQMAAENLTYSSEMFDIIVGIAILHHLDLPESLKQIKRVLKKGGKAYYMEPLGHNPIINLYRKMTPHLRSKDEFPMRFEQFSLIEGDFSKFEHEEYYLTTTFALFLYAIGAYNLMMTMRDVLIKLDQIILTFLPKMKKYCWYSILEIEK